MQGDRKSAKTETPEHTISAFHLTSREHLTQQWKSSVLFESIREFIKTDHILGYNTALNKFKIIESMEGMFPDHS